jgi:UDP-N-acetylmuramate dehydrogenase
MILNNSSLKPHNTFGLDYKAERIVIVRSEEEISNIIREGGIKGAPHLAVGAGSNLLFVSDFHGTIFHPEIEGIKIDKEDDSSVEVTAGAGVNWDNFVEWTVGQGFCGLENLSYIPGHVGASPVQNIGAYGAEAKDFVQSVKAISLETGEPAEFRSDECKFGYRDSIFKNELKNKYLITQVTFQLSKEPRFRLGYGFLEAETAAIGDISLKNIRLAIINIRTRKLPDPNVIGNAGSFFKNPVVTTEKADEIKSNNPLVPVYNEQSGGKKLAAGWLIEQCGWKGRRIGDAGVHDQQALVLVNYGNAKGIDIYNLSEKIKISVFEKFGIDLQREVEVIGSI